MLLQKRSLRMQHRSFGVRKASECYHRLAKVLAQVWYLALILLWLGMPLAIVSWQPLCTLPRLLLRNGLSRSTVLVVCIPCGVKSLHSSVWAEAEWPPSRAHSCHLQRA